MSTPTWGLKLPSVLSLPWASVPMALYFPILTSPTSNRSQPSRASPRPYHIVPGTKLSTKYNQQNYTLSFFPKGSHHLLALCRLIPQPSQVIGVFSPTPFVPGPWTWFNCALPLLFTDTSRQTVSLSFTSTTFEIVVTRYQLRSPPAIIQWSLGHSPTFFKDFSGSLSFCPTLLLRTSFLLLLYIYICLCVFFCWWRFALS